MTIIPLARDGVTNDAPSLEQIATLQWLAREDATPYGSCKGRTLDALIAAGLAIVSGSCVLVTDAVRDELRGHGRAS